MTVFGWDASHFDGLLGRGTLARAAGEGIGFVTHKIGEGLTDTEGTGDDTALAAARDAGIGLLGGYLVPRSTASPTAQVDRWIQLADAGEPWWRQHPGWFWQIDLERWPYDSVPASVGVACARQLRERTGRWTILYASHGQYGDQLDSWDGPLWNADYTSHPAGPAAVMYPGDGWRPAHGGWTGGWAAYSGREPTFLQYTSSATIAGLTTCDANAYRGSLSELRALIEGDAMELTDAVPSTATPDVPHRDVNQVYGDLWNGIHIRMGQLFAQLSAQIAEVDARIGQPAPVVVTDADRTAIAQQLAAALAPLVTPQATATVDELARRLAD